MDAELRAKIEEKVGLPIPDPISAVEKNDVLAALQAKVRDFTAMNIIGPIRTEYDEYIIHVASLPVEEVALEVLEVAPAETDIPPPGSETDSDGTSEDPPAGSETGSDETSDDKKTPDESPPDDGKSEITTDELLVAIDKSDLEKKYKDYLADEVIP